PLGPDRARQARDEVAGAGAEIDRGHARLELEQRDHLVRLLPGLALRVVEPPRPLLGVLEPVLAVPAGPVVVPLAVPAVLALVRVRLRSRLRRLRRLRRL